jgi:hypothetical protein
MVTIVFNRNSECKIAILPQGHEMNSTYFIVCVIQPLVEMYSPDERKSHERKLMLHFDNGRIHNTEEVQEPLTGLGFKRLENPPYSLDWAPCDFFLFGAMKRNLCEQCFDSLDRPFDARESSLGRLCADVLQTVFEE